MKYTSTPHYAEVIKLAREHRIIKEIAEHLGLPSSVVVGYVMQAKLVHLLPKTYQ